MSRMGWNIVFFVGCIVAFACIFGAAALMEKHGDVARSMPIVWVLIAIVVLCIVPVYLGYYHTTWQDLTGGVGGRPSLFIIFVLVTAFGGILLNAIRQAIFK